MKLKDTLIGLFAVALLGAVAWMWLAPGGIARAPDIAFTTLEGENIALSALRGRPVLVNFWATTCPGCIKEMPQLETLYRELAPRGFEIIAIAMPYDPPSQVLAFSRARKLPWPVALDIKGEATRAFGDVRLTPSSFLIAPDGRIVHQKIGELDMTRVRGMITDMLAQADTPRSGETN